MTTDRTFDQYFENGRLFGRYHWDSPNKCPEGDAFWNYPSGKRMVEGYYKGGIRAGEWKWFTEDGELIKTTDFGDGEYVKMPSPHDFNIEICTPQNTIIIEEEYGYRQWLWLPDRTIDEIVQWWSELDSISPWILSPWSLPGLLINATDDLYYFWSKCEASKQFYTGHLHDDDDSYLQKPTGEFIYHKNYELVIAEGNY